MLHVKRRVTLGLWPLFTLQSGKQSGKGKGPNYRPEIVKKYFQLISLLLHNN